MFLRLSYTHVHYHSKIFLKTNNSIIQLGYIKLIKTGGGGKIHINAFFFYFQGILNKMYQFPQNIKQHTCFQYW